MAKTYGSKTCRIEFLSSGFKALLMGPEVKDTVYRTADLIAKEAGDGFTARTFYGRGPAGRVMATVDADTYEAREREATEKVLTRAATRRREI